MNLFERLERLRHVLVTSEHDENPKDVSVCLNHRLFDKPPTRDGQMMAAAAAQQAYARGMGDPPPPPTKKWIAVAGRFWADDDDAEKAVVKLEMAVVAAVESGLDAKIGNYRHALEKAERISRSITDIVLSAPSGSGADRD